MVRRNNSFTPPQHPFTPGPQNPGFFVSIPGQHPRQTARHTSALPRFHARPSQGSGHTIKTPQIQSWSVFQFGLDTETSQMHVAAMVADVLLIHPPATLSPKTRPRRPAAYADVLDIQRILKADIMDPKADKSERARLALAWERLEERKRILRREPLPRSVDTSKLTHGRRTHQAADPQPAEPATVE